MRLFFLFALTLNLLNGSAFAVTLTTASAAPTAPVLVGTAATSAASTPAPEIRFLSSSVPSITPLAGILSGTPTRFQAPQRNLKLSVVFDHPLTISKFTLQSCAKDWVDGIQVFAAPGLVHQFIEGGKEKLEVKMETSEKTESVAIVFGRDSDLCLQGLTFFDEKGHPLLLHVASSVAATVDHGDHSTGAALIFDSHPETQSKIEEPLGVTFDTSQTFDRAIVWTGGGPLYARSIKLKGEKGWSETLPLRNSPSDQEIIFRKPYRGRHLSISAPEAGEIGELRLALGSKVQSIDLMFASRSDVKKKFSEADLSQTLDFRWVSGSQDNEKWMFIFRQDGTFFIRGFSDDQHQARGYSALGAFTVVRASKNKLRLKINGVRFPAGFGWDGVSCPFSCGTEGSLEGASVITDSLMLEKIDDASMMVRNRTPRAARTISIGDLKVHRAVDD